jgi:hypothetical protein
MCLYFDFIVDSKHLRMNSKRNFAMEWRKNKMPSVFPTRCWCEINFCGYKSQVQNPWDHTSFQFQCQHCRCLLSKILKWPNFKGHSTYLLPSFVFKGKFKCLEVPLPMSQRKVIQKKKKITTTKPNLTSCWHPQVKLIGRGLAGVLTCTPLGLKPRTSLVIPSSQNDPVTHHPWGQVCDFEYSINKSNSTIKL